MRILKYNVDSCLDRVRYIWLQNPLYTLTILKEKFLQQ